MCRVLFIHTRKPTPEPAMPHLGLASLAAVLRRAGHDVCVLDEVLGGATRLPSIEQVLAEFRPDRVGLSLYTATLDRSLAIAALVRERLGVPVLAGGPHATLFTDDLAATGRFDTVVAGEAEERIVELVESAEVRSSPVIVRCAPPDVRQLPWPDYTALLGHEAMAVYPVMTSRGCPFACSFCAVEQISSRTWRPRDPADCAAEVLAAKRRYASLQSLNISDDCPTCNLSHFKQFLRRLCRQERPLPMVVDNLRADRLDDELVVLMKSAGAGGACIGVEHGDPEVLALVNKHETHDDMRRAARLLRAHGMGLGLCFVIGLPGDSFERTGASIRFALELQPDLIFWNVCHPFPGTGVHRWFTAHGAQIDPPRTYTSYDTHQLRCPEPTVATPEFSKPERQRAYFWAVVATDQYALRPRTPFELLALGWRYRLLGPALASLIRRLRQLRPAEVFHRVRRKLVKPACAAPSR